MGFFNRLSDIVSANINDMLDRMENPEKMMKLLIREMEDGVQQAKGDLVTAIAHERRLEKEIARHKKKITEWQARAEEAVRRDRDDLARSALIPKKESEAILAALDLELKAAQEASASMKTQLRGIQAKCQEAKRIQALLTGRYKAARMQKKVATGPGKRKVKTEAFAEFDRMGDKIAHLEAEAEAMAQVRAYDKTANAKAVADEFAQIEAADTIEADLAALKTKVRKGSA
jgi:phage shock protein A